MFNFKVIIFTFLIVFTACAAFAQDDPIKVDSSLVKLNVGVADGRGRPITDLGRGDFTVYEDDVKQSIVNFQPTITPFSVVMILDMSGSTLGFRETIRQSAFRFIDALSPDDRVAVIEFYDKVNLRNDFTNNRKIIANSINVANGRGKTQLYKALDFSLEKLSAEGSRRKAIIVLTDGIDTSLQNNDRAFLEKTNFSDVTTAIKPEANDTLNRILNRADAQGVTIYPLALPTGDPAKLADPTPTQIAMFQAARTRLQILATRTGGTYNALNRIEEMSNLYGKIAADLRTLYTLDYQPTNEKRDGTFRKIRIEVNNPSLIARTREGYYAK